MPRPSPFHPRTAPLCEALRWKDWAGYAAVCSYTTYMEREYFAFRHAAGLIDVTPLCKYEVRGARAGEYLAWLMVRDVTRLKPNQVAYTCWCDEHGKIVDDGTVWRLDDDWYRVTAAEPSLAWLSRFAADFDVTVTDVGDRIAALSLQGPRSRAILQQVGDADLDALRFFYLARTRIGAAEVIVTRTGYTGDLGYEVWVDNEDALAVWDALYDAGRPHGLAPAGLDAMDVARIEAGFIMNGVDYYSAPHCLIESRKNTPYELDLGWLVHLDRPDFLGQAALRREAETGPAEKLVCLEYDWDDYERLFARHGLPPEVCPYAWRDPRPVFDVFGNQVGYATSGAWSPTMKRNLALALVRPEMADRGSRLKIEVMVEYVRRKCLATVVEKPVFRDPRTRSLPQHESV